MLLHLIIWAIRAASKDSGASPSRIGSRRKTKAGQVTLECPFCQNLGVATQYNLDELTGSGWLRMMDTYECPTCRKSMNAEAMQNDGTGVLTARTWDCPACRVKNPAVRFDCSSCGMRLQ